MTRINLFNYRALELYYRRLRVYLLCFLVIVIPLLINILIYATYQIQILFQQSRNLTLMAKLKELDKDLAPISDFNARHLLVQEQINWLNLIENRRDDTVTFFQNLGAIVPQQIYFISVEWNRDQVKFIGVSSSPLYLANFLDQLRAKNGIFINTELKTNDVVNSNGYNFEISSHIKKDLLAKHDAKA